MTEKQRFDVSLRMTVFFGPGAVPADADDLHPIRMSFSMGRDGAHALVAVGEDLPADQVADIVFLVDPDGCREVLGDTPGEVGTWHLASDARAIALALLTCDLPEPAGRTIRTVKAVELLCAVITGLAEDRLIPADSGGALSELDARRIVAARRMIDESWSEKMTLDSIARACGLNRVKLTRGFRAMFDCTVAEAIADRRLNGAHHLLLVTDLPVSSVGYRCGYINNASFTRAFSRRFGMAPTQLRSRAIAA